MSMHSAGSRCHFPHILFQVLQASLLPGVVKLVDMTNNTVIPTMYPGLSARFTQYINGE